MYGKKLIVILPFVVAIFTYTSFVQANGNHGSHSNDAMTEEDHQGMNHDAMTEEEHQPAISHGDSGHGTDGHVEDGLEVDVPPNYKVLGTFGGINLAFLSLGAVLKIRKRKEKQHETLK